MAARQHVAMTGRCLCGGVNWSTDGQVRNVLECHCDRCQRLTGNYMAATAARTDDLTIIGDVLRWYSPEDDPNVAYGFCSTCGSTLFFRAGIVDGTNELTSMSAGTIDAPSGLFTEAIWFAGNAADHVRPDDRITQFDGQP